MPGRYQLLGSVSALVVLAFGPPILAAPPATIDNQQPFFTQNDPAAQADPATFDGGILRPTKAYSFSQQFLVTAKGGTVDNRNGDVAFTNAISGVGGLTMTGGNTTFLTGANSYSGGTTVAAGTLIVGDGGVGGSIVGNVTDNGTLAFSRSDAVTFAGVVSGTGALQQAGNGTLTLTGANLYTGGTGINAGVLQIGNGGTTGAITGNVRDDATLAFNRSDSIVFAGAITGVGGLEQNGAGTTILTGASSYSGGTTISGGTLQIGNGGNTGSLFGLVSNNATLAFDRSDTVTFQTLISGDGAVKQIGTGTLVLTGNDTYSGGTTIAQGTLMLGSGGTTGSILGDVIDRGVFAINRSDTLTIDSIVEGSGSLAQIGKGTTILTGGNAYTGGTTIAAGTLRLGDGKTGGSIVGNVIDNGTLSFDHSNGSTFAGVISGTGAVKLIGAGTTTLTGDSTYTGLTTIAAGALRLGDGGTSGSIAGDVANAGALIFDRSDSSVLAGAISGKGAVRLIGAGTTILTGASRYTGGTAISAGTLQIGNGGITGSITGDVANSGMLVFDRSDVSTFAGVISGTGAVRQIGTGTTIFTAANLYRGGTTIAAGTLRIGAGGTAGSIVGDVTDNGTLAFDRSDTVSFAGTISGSGALVQAGTGTLILTGSVDYTGGTAITAGTLQGNSATLVGNIDDKAALVFAQASDGVYAGALSGDGTVLKQDSGTLTLTGDSSGFTGATTVSAGTLEIGDARNAAAILGGKVAVLAGGDLRGHGTVLGSVTNAGTVAPGGSIGTLTIGGNYAQSSTGTLSIELSPTASSRLVVGGSAAVAGTLRLVVDPGAYKRGTIFTYLTADDGITGAFANVVTLGQSGMFAPIYKDGMLELMLAGPTPLLPNATTPNGRAVAGVLDAAGLVVGIESGFNRLLDGVANLTPHQREQAFEALGGAVYGDLRTVMRDTARDFMGDIGAELRDPAAGAWGHATGRFESIDGGGGTHGLTDNSAGFVAGYDTALDASMTAGVAANYAHNTVSTRSLPQQAYLDAFNAAAYGEQLWGDIFGDAIADIGVSHGTAHRRLDAAGLGGRTSGVIDGYNLAGMLKAGYRLTSDRYLVEPYVGISYAFIQQDAVDETNGGAANLHVGGKTSQAVQSALGVRGAMAYTVGAAVLSPEIQVAWEHELAAVAPNIGQNFAAFAGNGFSIAGANPGRDVAAIDARLSYAANPKLALYAAYDGVRGAYTTADAISFGMNYQW
jgi:outer membrane autotransporter protein